jgi:hypothetical protein
MLSSIRRVSSDSIANIPSLLEFSIILYFILIFPVRSPPTAIFALIFASSLLA